MASDPLASFNPRVRDWFTRSFERPTEAQAQAWPAIARGENVLVLRAHRLRQDARRVPVGARPAGRRAAPEGERRTRLVYVSPLKALSYDVEKNLRAPLKGIGGDISVAIRTGDTPQKERQAMLRKPPGRPDHDARVALPDAHLARARVPRRRRGGDRRRDPRGGADQARRAPGAHASSGSRTWPAGRSSGSGCRPPSGRSRRSGASWWARAASAR